MQRKLLKRWFFSVFIILGILFSCQKFEVVEDLKNDSQTSLKSISVNPDFNWRTTKLITLELTSTKSQILYITSTDQLIRYHKAMILGNSETYIVKLSIPIYIEKLKINDNEYELSSNNISIEL
jgi:hypothetical protein